MDTLTIGIWEVKGDIPVHTPEDVLKLLSDPKAIPEEAHRILSRHGELPKEVLVAVHVDVNMEAKAVQIAAVGGRDSCLSGANDIFRKAVVRTDTAGLILLHNHPFAKMAIPSPDDIRLTQKYRDSSELFDVTILDHIVVATKGWFSMKLAGEVFDKYEYYYFEGNEKAAFAADHRARCKHSH